MKPILLVYFALISTYMLSQPRVVTFGDTEENSGNRAYDEKNIIKLNIWEFFSSDFSLYYERQLLNKITAEVGAGITYNDFFGGLFSPSPHAPEGNHINKMLGNSFFAGVRFYTSRTFDGFYFSPQYKYRKYNWKNDFQIPTDNNDSETLFVDESRIHSIARISFGYALFYHNNMYFDFQGGVGISSIKETLYNQFEERIETMNLNFRPRIHLGFKIGYAF